MRFIRTHQRLLIAAVILAVPIEALGAYFLKYMPLIGVPRDPNPLLCLGGSLSTLLHVPGLWLSGLLCAKLCPPQFVLSAVTIAGGYFDSFLIAMFFALVFKFWVWVVGR